LTHASVNDKTLRMPRPALSAVTELFKPITWFPPMWAFACGVVASGVAMDGKWGLALIGIALAGPLVCATSQAVNDWFDRHVDAINEPHRPIPSGRMPGRWGLGLAVLWTGVSLAVALALGPWGFGAGRALAPCTSRAGRRAPDGEIAGPAMARGQRVRSGGGWLAGTRQRVGTTGRLRRGSYVTLAVLGHKRRRVGILGRRVGILGSRVGNLGHGPFHPFLCLVRPTCATAATWPTAWDVR
jgi:hypothetical protein